MPLTINPSSFSSYSHFCDHAGSTQSTHKRNREFENTLITSNSSFTTEGFCFVCKKQVNFKTDFLCAVEHDNNGKKIPNWRESVICPACKLNSRVRSSFQYLVENLGCQSNSKIYITEQTTPFYHYLKNNFSNVIGSEFLGTDIPEGFKTKKFSKIKIFRIRAFNYLKRKFPLLLSNNYLNKIFLGNTPIIHSDIRNENMTSLTFSNGRFDFILSFDIFEHMPGYYKALEECMRCLKSGGALLFTVPFDKNAEKNLVRATVDRTGNVQHILEPEYHRDPLNINGCLVFNRFGWEILEELKRIGFVDVAMVEFWSDKLGYLGQQLLFIAKKP